MDIDKRKNILFSSWVQQASHCIGDTYDVCLPFIDNKSDYLEPLVRFVAAQLQISCHLTSESILLLVLNGRLWDADLLLRSVLEGTFKFAYLLEGKIEDQRRKADEYWNVLPDMVRLTRHHRASRIIETVGDKHDASQWHPIRELIIDNDEAELLGKKYNKKTKQMLAQQWSFSRITRYFMEHKNTKYHAMGILGYDYGMKSHLIHQDGDGVGMIWDRYGRDDDRRNSIEIAHAGRIISDICSFGVFRSAEVLTASKQNPENSFDIYNKYKKLFDEISQARVQWHDIEYGKPSE